MQPAANRKPQPAARKPQPKKENYFLAANRSPQTAARSPQPAARSRFFSMYVGENKIIFLI